jgi:F-box protein 11
MKLRAWMGAAVALGIVILPAPAAANPPALVRVPEQHASIAEALAAAPDGATIEIAPGAYSESVTINRPVNLRGGAGDVIINGQSDQPIITIIDTADVTIHGLTLRGGQYGILVFHSQDVVIRNNLIQNNRLVGIKVRMGEASIVGNTVTDTQAPYGKGIHITNTMDWPTSIVQGNTVSNNATSGIATNMAMVRVIHNTVTDNGRRGIAITEMSEAVVADNEVTGNAENGIYISDQSIAIVCNNIVTDSQYEVFEGSGRYGNGITVDFQAQAELHNNVIVGNANRAVSVLDTAQIMSSDNVMQGNGSDTIWTDSTATQLRNLDLPESCQ